MTYLVSTVPHRPEALARANGEHRQLVDAVRARDATLAIEVITGHLRATERTLAAFWASR